MKINTILLLILIVCSSNTLIFPQTLGQQFCYCKLINSEKSENTISLGYQYHWNLNSHTIPDFYSSFKGIYDIPFNSENGVYLSSEIVLRQNESEQGNKLRQLADQSSGINFIVAYYRLLKLNDRVGIYIYPELFVKANDLQSNTLPGMVRYYSYGIALNGELMLKNAICLNPIVFGARSSYSFFSSNKSFYITGNKSPSISEFSTFLSLTIYKNAIFAISNAFSVMFIKEFTPYYSTQVSILIPRFDLIIKLFE